MTPEKRITLPDPKSPFNRTATNELKSGGADIPATEENKDEYIETIIEYHISCCLAKVFDEHGPKLLIGGMFTTDVDKPFKDKSAPSESVFVSSQFTTRTEKYRQPVVLMRGIEN
ncbi:hypothetical protein BS47DRAFT_1368929 [Hydnum rufescens UP504]|uniref:Uncharacterized protein n=1 Tax=Hydnum rufescens UP504 TaxID=1448309 RepID=A0A9P6AER4_9AGAM|nr:hypothetical protein BS47DRAFT_1368929 [Hydnum rufescens UP504]